MRTRTLVAGWALLLTGTTGLAAGSCPAAGAAVVERFTGADCPACWSTSGLPGGAADWVLDWIAPRGPEAALAPAALPEAAERARRAGLVLPDAPALVVHRQALPSRPGLRLQVQTGLPLNGYLGLQFESRGSAPPGSTGWLALLEVLPAGSEGSQVERHLLRAVAGPLPLGSRPTGRPTQHLHAVRWPDGALPGRVQALAWIEAPDGRMLAAASEACPQR